MLSILRNLKGNRSGASAAEYALIVALIGVAIVTGMGTLGGFFEDSMTGITTAAAG